MCNKIPYRSKEEANKDVRETRMAFRTVRSDIHKKGRDRKLKPYLCPTCGMWHLTSLPKKIRKSRYGK